MTENLQTNRLILRPFLLEDAPMVFALNSDPEVMKYLPKDEVYTSQDQASEFLSKYLDKSKDWPFARWAVIRKSDKILLGWCGLMAEENGDVDLGFRFLREHWGRGYATESGQRWVAYGFGPGGLTQIIARAADRNLGSQKVLTKLGFNRRPEEDGKEDGFLWRKFSLRRP